MKKHLILFFYILFLGMASAQSQKTVQASQKKNQHLKVFDQCMGSGDISTAINALNYYIAETDENTSFTDTLAMLYLQSGNYPQCYYWADKRLKTKPEDNSLLEMKGVCLDKLQQPKEAIEVFEKLFKKTNSPYHAYKLMELQYGIKRLSECLATAQLAEKLVYKPEYTITYTAGEQNGRTYLQSGVLNIHALVLYDLDRKVEAKLYFEKALALDSTFVLAKQNLNAVNAVLVNKEKAITTPAAPTPVSGKPE